VTSSESGSHQSGVARAYLSVWSSEISHARKFLMIKFLAFRKV
jgi:hypothetical protein